MKTPVLTLAAILIFTFFTINCYALIDSHHPDQPTKNDTNQVSTDAQVNTEAFEDLADFDIEVDEDGTIIVNPMANLIMEIETNYREVEFDEDFDIEVDEEGNITINPMDKLLMKNTPLPQATNNNPKKSK